MLPGTACVRAAACMQSLGVWGQTRQGVLDWPPATLCAWSATHTPAAPPPAGYFSSRPTSKAYIRSATSYLQAARQLEAFVGLSRKDGGVCQAAA